MVGLIKSDTMDIGCARNGGAVASEVWTVPGRFRVSGFVLCAVEPSYRGGLAAKTRPGGPALQFRIRQGGIRPIRGVWQARR